MNMKLVVSCVLLSAGIACNGLSADGVWSNQLGGVWSDAANWENGVIAGDGGVATINSSDSSFSISNDIGLVTLAGLTLNASVAEGRAIIKGGTLTMVSPAIINNPGNPEVNFVDSTLAGSADLYITGSGRTFLGQNNLLSGRTIISNGNVRAVSDSAFGPAPAVLDPDAIVLDGGGLMNGAGDAVFTISPNRGITLTANGGYLACGYYNAEAQINSPITGTGFLGINNEASIVVLGNSANDYTGGTQIGTQGPGCHQDFIARLMLAQDEVIPDTGGLIIAGNFSLTNSLYGGLLDLNGKTESVDTLSSGPRATITSSVPNQGRLIIGKQGDHSGYKGILTGGATVEKRGSGNFDLTGATLSEAGTIDLRAGTVLAGGPNLGNVTVLSNGGSLDIVAPDEPHVLAAGEDNALDARILLETNMILSVDSDAGNFVFSGIVTTNSARSPEPTLTINNNGAAVLFGSTNVLSPAVLDGDVASTAGLVLTNNVWLCRLPSASYTAADGVNLVLDGNDQMNGSLVLSNFSATVVAGTTLGGDGTVSVLNGNTLSFSTLKFLDGRLQDKSGNTLNATNDISLTSSTAVFTGEGSIAYSGDLTGTGTVEKRGGGTTLLTSTDSSLTGDIVIYDGTLAAGSEDVLGGANVTLAGGRSPMWMAPT